MVAQTIVKNKIYKGYRGNKFNKRMSRRTKFTQDHTRKEMIIRIVITKR